MDNMPLISDALTSVGLAVLVLDEQDRVIDVNIPALRHIGLNRDKLIGKPVLAFLPLTILQECKTKRSNAEEKAAAEKIVLPRVANDPLFLSVSVSRWTDAADQVRSLVLMRDVSAERRVAENAGKELALSKHAIECAKIGVFEYDPTTDTVSVSAIWRELLEIAPDEHLDVQVEWRSRVHPDDLSEALRPIQLCLDGVVERASCEYRLLSRDRTAWRWMQTNIAVVSRDPSGAATLLVGAQIDVTERKTSDEKLRISLEQFRSSFDHAPIGKALLKLNGRWQMVNSALCDLFGYSEEDLLKTDFQSLTHPDDLDADLANVEKLLNGEISFYTMEKRYYRSNGAIMWGLLHVGLVRAENGLPDHFISQVIDITEKRRLDQMKSNFVSVVSHELRTPLTAILGSLTLLEFEEEAFSDEVLRLLFIAKTNGDRLGTLINDILDFQKFSAKQMRFAFSTCQVATLVEETVLANLGLTDKFGVRFNPIFKDRSLIGRIDPKRFHQVMANLLSNAAKFAAPDTEIEICSELHGPHIRISVSNTGSGIPESFRDNVFRPFSQAQNLSDRTSGGTGLGLSITKQIVEQMGGTIGFESEPSERTIFWFTVQNATLGS